MGTCSQSVGVFFSYSPGNSQTSIVTIEYSSGFCETGMGTFQYSLGHTQLNMQQFDTILGLAIFFLITFQIKKKIPITDQIKNFMMGKHKWSSVAIFPLFESIVKSICLSIYIIYVLQYNATYYILLISLINKPFTEYKKDK